MFSLGWCPSLLAQLGELQRQDGGDASVVASLHQLDDDDDDVMM